MDQCLKNWYHCLQSHKLVSSMWQPDIPTYPKHDARDSDPVSGPPGSHNYRPSPHLLSWPTSSRGCLTIYAVPCTSFFMKPTQGCSTLTPDKHPNIVMLPYDIQEMPSMQPSFDKVLLGKRSNFPWSRQQVPAVLLKPHGLIDDGTGQVGPEPPTVPSLASQPSKERKPQVVRGPG